jgi:hypothetical protein
MKKVASCCSPLPGRALTPVSKEAQLTNINSNSNEYSQRQRRFHKHFHAMIRIVFVFATLIALIPSASAANALESHVKWQSSTFDSTVDSKARAYANPFKSLD